MGFWDQWKQMDRIKRYDVIISVVVLIVALLLVAGAIAFSNQGSTAVDKSPDIKFSVAQKDVALPEVDTDGDGLSNLAENYRYGTNESNPDTDGDGIGDAWEVKYGVRDLFTNQFNVDPNDPTDAYEDPDGDGYDFNHNGRIDSFFDNVFLSDLKVAPNSDYEIKTVENLLSNKLEFSGSSVRIEHAVVDDNGSYRLGLGGEVDNIIRFSIADLDAQQLQNLSVEVQSRGNRPVELHGPSLGGVGTNDLVDIQGIFCFQRPLAPCFNANDPDPKLVIRGGEQFTNIMEYQARFDVDLEDLLNPLNETSPVNADTDADGMTDGWEAFYGLGHVNSTNDRGVPFWEWIVPIDPTYPGDRYLDPDQDAANYGVSENCTGDAQGITGFNIDEYHLGTDPGDPDTDRDSYQEKPTGLGLERGGRLAIDFAEICIYGTDPINPDTDGDHMFDGWEIYYGLNPLDPNDRFADPDGDELQNIAEFDAGTHPKDPDTDSDKIPDGWEVAYHLDPLRAADAQEDNDLDETGASHPDGLLNLEEYYNNTDPFKLDTDGDRLHDDEEIIKGWLVWVNDKEERYFTCATAIDTDLDDVSDDEDGDNYFGADEEYILDGPKNGQDIDDDNDGSSNPNEEHDLNDYNEVRGRLRGYTLNASAPDTDGDGISDFDELYTIDADPDAGWQYLDPTQSDSDGDGLSDLQEVLGIDIWTPVNNQRATVRPYALRADSDSDGLSDGLEVLTDFDPIDGQDVGNPKIRPIKDIDGSVLRFEVVYSTVGIVNSSDPKLQDSDYDGMTDGFEFDHSDLDKDGLPTFWELAYGLFKLDPTRINSDASDPNDDDVLDSEEDFDLDGFNNIAEYQHRTEPFNPDTDADDILDGSDTYLDPSGRPLLLRQPVYSDTDRDGMPDWWERIYDLNPILNSDGKGDKDNDGFHNIDEWIYNTDPSNGKGDDWWNHEWAFSDDAFDSEPDGIADWWERLYFEPTAGSTYLQACDPGDNSDGPAAGFTYGDNWTNLQEWERTWVDAESSVELQRVMGQNVYRTIPVMAWEDPRTGFTYNGNDTDGDTANDDRDKIPGVIPSGLPERPLRVVAKGTNALNPIIPSSLDGDIDQDGLEDVEEFRRPFGQTDPLDPDSDRDGMPDGFEVAYGRPINGTNKYTIDPLVPTDWYDDPDQDGMNYSSKFNDANGNLQYDEGENWIITRKDFNGDGFIDPIWENESFPNLQEYVAGTDVDADGINELTTDPSQYLSPIISKNLFDGNGRPLVLPIPIPDAYFLLFLTDGDQDLIPFWYEKVYNLNDREPIGDNGSAGDPDADQWSNIDEYRADPWPTNPHDSRSKPTSSRELGPTGGRQVGLSNHGSLAGGFVLVTTVAPVVGGVSLTTGAASALSLTQLLGAAAAEADPAIAQSALDPPMAAIVSQTARHK